MEACFDKVDIDGLGQHVKKWSKCDPNRGNMYIDAGFASNLSSRRKKGEDCGVAKPAELAPHSSGKQIFDDAMVALSKFSLLICPNSMKNKLFQEDKRRTSEFAGKHVEGNLLEVMRVALTNEKFLVGCHADKHNDVLDWNEGVVNYSTWIVIDGEWWRLSLIGYSRKSISDYYRRLTLYGPLVDKISHFVDSLPSERVNIYPSLLDFTNVPGGVKRMKPHVNKCVFYSSFVECCHLLQARLDLTKWHLFGMMVNVTSSETPDYMWQVTQEILASGPLQEKAKALGPIDFGVFLYHKSFDKKDDVAAGKLPVAGQRHQPHNNIRQSSHKIEASIRNLIKLHHGLNLLDSRLHSDIHYYCRAIALLEQSWEKTGVYGAGALTAQHIFGVGVLLGIYPAEMLQHALLAEGGNAYKYLNKHEHLKDHIKDTYQLLANGACYLGLSWFEMENVLCKWTQFEGGTDKTAVDSLYLGQFIYYMDKRNRLVKVTSEGESLVLPCTTRCRQSETLDSTVGAPTPGLNYSFWQQRLYDKRKVFPMKSQTKLYLKNFIAEIPDGRPEVDHAATEAATIGRKRNAAPTKQREGVKAHAQVAKPATRKRKSASSKVGAKRQRASVVVTGSVIVPGIPRQHRLVMEKSRQPFDMGLLAREALSIPSEAKLSELMVTNRKPFKGAGNVRKMNYVSVDIRIGPPLSIWSPPANATSLLGGLLGSFVDEDTRWFLNKRDATRYTLICAALVGNKDFTSNVLVPRYFATDTGEDLVVLYDPVRNRHGARNGEKVLFAAITRLGTRRASFHLVDELGKTYCPEGGFPI